MARLNEYAADISRGHATARTEEAERYQRQRLEERAVQINSLMHQLREKESSDGAGASSGRQNTVEDRMDVDEPEDDETDLLLERERLLEEEQRLLGRVEEPERQSQGRREPRYRDVAQILEREKQRAKKRAHASSKDSPKKRIAPPVQIQDENMFVRGDWWTEWTSEELMMVVAYYKQDLHRAMQGHSGLNHAELTALQLGEIKRLVRRDAKKMLLAQYSSSLNKINEAQVRQEQSEKRGGERSEPVVEQDPSTTSSQNTNLYTGMPKSSQQTDMNCESTASDDETNAVVANTTTLSLLEPQNITLTEEQQVIFDLVAKGESLFFTGGAGTGKSVLIKEIKNHCESKGVVCKVTAPTGLAAVNVDGITIHRWTGLGLMKESAEVCIAKLFKNPRAAAMWKFTDVLIIDECSMISGAMFDMIDTIARAVRSNFFQIAHTAVVQYEKELRCKKKARNYNFLKEMLQYTEKDHARDQVLRDLPFGGMQIVCVGDFYQLPPVPSFEDKNTYARKHGASAQLPPDFLFNSEAFQKVFGDKRLRLTVAKRQTEGSVFASMLNMFRTYKGTTPETDALRNYFSQFIGRHPPGQQTVHLQSTTTGVEATNQRELQLLDGPEVFFYASDMRNTTEGYSQEFIDRAMRDINAEDRLCLKPGAQVMYLKNDYDKGLVNGHMGQVAFLMTYEMYSLYKDDLDVLFVIYHYIKSRNLRSLSRNAKVPPDLEQHLGMRLEHYQWSYYRYALMHIDEVYRQEALAQKKKNRELEEQKKVGRENTKLLVVFRLADEYIADGESDQQFILVPTAEFAKLDYSRLLARENRDANAPKYPTICSRVQLPMSLSWALTIHKCQGQTLIRTVVDMKGMFTEGQAYVAMTRVRSPDDLRLTCFEVPKVTRPEVIKFDESIKDSLTVKKEGANGVGGFALPNNAPHHSTPSKRSSPPPSSYESAISDFDSNAETCSGTHYYRTRAQ
ncbi:YALIA101S08e01068g1_1 [Yarrowia lipolytica]|nr:ATP-dependent DNA helicase PIF1 [Yarrowia lipolytica]SEI35692.1 YALIA101S08e01068g1_1 [Yarrowia lipolytica]